MCRSHISQRKCTSIYLFNWCLSRMMANNLIDNIYHLYYSKYTQRRQSGLKSGGRGSGLKNFVILGKCPKNLDFFRQFHKQKNRFFRANFQKISIFSDDFTKKFDFSRQIFEEF